MKIIYKGGEHRMDETVLTEVESDFVPMSGDIIHIPDTEKVAIVRSREILDVDTIIIWVDVT